MSAQTTGTLQLSSASVAWSQDTITVGIPNRSGSVKGWLPHAPAAASIRRQRNVRFIVVVVPLESAIRSTGAHIISEGPELTGSQSDPWIIRSRSLCVALAAFGPRRIAAGTLQAQSPRMIDALRARGVKPEFHLWTGVTATMRRFARRRPPDSVSRSREVTAASFFSVYPGPFVWWSPAPVSQSHDRTARDRPRLTTFVQ